MSPHIPSPRRAARRRFLVALIMTAMAATVFTVAAPATRAEAATTLVNPVGGTIWGYWNWRCYSSDPAEKHEGIDIGGNGGAIVQPAAPGTVAAVAKQNWGWGNHVIIDHADGWRTIYAHLRDGSIPATLKKGSKVTLSTTIGRVGETGAAYGEHLHLEILRNGVNVTSQARAALCKNWFADGATIRVDPLATRTAFSDHDFDGRSDLIAIPNGSATPVFHPGVGNGRFAPNAVVGGSWAAARLATAGDFNGDGVADVMMVRADGNIYQYAGLGTGRSYAAPVKVGSGWSGVNLIEGGDLDGDGRTDIIARRSDGSLSAYFSNGRGFGRTVSMSTSKGWGQSRFIVAGHFTADDRIDLVTVNTNGNVYRYAGTGSGTVGGPTQIATGWSGMTFVTGGADYTRDRYGDLYARKSDGTLWLYPGRNTGVGSAVRMGTDWNGARLIL